MAENLESSYDQIAPVYAERIAGELVHKPFDRDILERFGTLVGDRGGVLDLGCGPGHVSRFLADQGISVSGIDLSAGMIAEARRLNPDISFSRGSMLSLEGHRGTGGIVAFYSIIHIPRDLQVPMFACWLSALVPGGLLLLSFHIGETDRHLEELWGEPVSLDFLFFECKEVEERMQRGGFQILESHEREPYPGVEVETRRGYILARRPM